MTDEEIASESGLPCQLVRALSQLTDWTGVDIWTMQKFLEGCKVDFEDYKEMHRISEYLRREPNWGHLKRDPEWQTRWLPLIERWTKQIHGSSNER